MKITINVTDRLFARDITNAFQDFFCRVISDIVRDLNDDRVGLCGRYELETATILKEAFSKAAYNEETLSDKAADLTDKHGEESRQIDMYNDQLRKALALLERVRVIHSAAIREQCCPVSSITSRLLHEIDLLNAEVEGGTDGA